MNGKPVVDRNRRYSSTEIIEILKAHGWTLKRIKGDHYHFFHPDLGGPLPVPHPKKDVPLGTQRNIFKRAGLL
ncbi:type II toxin-antitoxin system HicA family toxin [Kyrpidia tusciae]|uniref:YcfA family protein n=1 Tax=Kyrpidia tusciae (strain DSM 2912 / NBRC 15312 / T2) TaxID=562970 RepID=D5WW16_KYRT2|nr:type II toxin-antitoxin system HicA family toxin [Kyrpidia tusciae]ADG05648.1 YcfA family protein [Kyrpidia tusciae DSM 2912]